MGAGCRSLSSIMSCRRGRVSTALLVTVALGMLPCAARAQEGTPDRVQAPQPKQGELPEVKVEAPKPPPKPAAVPKPERSQEPAAPRPVAASKAKVLPKRAATPVRSVEPVAAPPLPPSEPIVAPDLIDVSPVSGSGIDRDKIPANVPQPLRAQDFDNAKVPDLLQAMFQGLPFTSLGNVSGNQFQQDFDYRGFVASPVQGTPQGLAIYQNGVRINESWGDVINWDFIPQMAINRMTLQPNNPIFGLNAIGGAISIDMKNGFNYHGTEIDGLGGSFGRRTVAVQTGLQSGNMSIYGTADATNDVGWKDLSSSSYLRRTYLDFGVRGGEQTEFHLQFTGANNNLGAPAATPLEMLNQRWSSVYTTPQATHLQLAFGEATASWRPTSTLSFDGVGYYRGFRQAHTDGNGTDAQPCDPDGELFGQLCIGDDDTPINRNLVTLNSLLPGAFLGEIDRNWTSTNSFGGTLQATNTTQVFGHDNHVVVGMSVDHGRTQFRASSELGTVDQNLFVTGQGIFIDQPDADLTPVNLRALNTYTGIYATDTFDLTSRLSVTAGARWNMAQISLTDETGTNPMLNSSSKFQRLNPVIGATYKVLPNITAYAGYSEANRAPTPLELGCSDPAHPCMIDAFLIADPPLQQVVSHTYEAGLRGNSGTNVKTGLFNWSFGLFRISTTNDIINVASAVVPMFGYFQNAAKTRRQGIEAKFNYKQDRWNTYANYTFIDATYQTALTLSSANNPAADADGNIFVVPGDHIPGIPNQRFKVGAEYNFTDAFTIGADLNVIGSQYLIHDDSNQNPKVPAYWVVNMHASYQLTPNVQLFGLVQNLFNQHYYQAGTFFETSGFTSNTPGGASFATFNDPRTFLPGMPLAIYGGVKGTF